MEIRRLQIEGFGVFRHLSIGPLPGGLVIFSGRNEAGKSTLLSFVNTMLFGFPDARRGERQFLPIHGGSYGGRIVLSTKRYGQITIERIRSSGRTSFRLYGPDGSSLDEMVLKGIFGGVTRQLFQNVYSFSLKELQSLDSLRREDIRDAVYGAGYGTSFLAVPQTMKELRKERDMLFRPAGRKQAINKLLFELKDVNARLKKARKEIDDYERLTRSLKNSRDRLNRLRQKRQLQARTLDNLQAAVKAWPDWLKLASIQARLSSIDKDERIKGLSLHMASQVEEAEERLQIAKAELRDIREGLTEVRAKLETKRPDYALLEKKEAISTILLGRDKFLKLQQLSQTLKGEIEDLDREIGLMMQRLGPAWTADRIREAAFSALDMRKLERFKERFNEIRQGSVQLGQRLSIRLQDQKALKTQQDRLSARSQELRDRLGGLDAETLKRLSAKGDRLRHLTRQSERLEQALAERSKALEAAIEEVSQAASAEFLRDLDVTEFTKEANGLHRDMMDTTRQLEAANEQLEALLARREEMNDQIRSRQAAIEEMDNDPRLVLKEHKSYVRAYSIARNLAGRQGQELGIEAELSRLETELRECSRQADAKKAEIQGPSRAHTTGLLVSAGLIMMLVAALLLYLKWPVSAWGMCLVLSMTCLLAAPILKRRWAVRRRFLQEEIARLSGKFQELDARRQKLVDFLDLVNQDRGQLAKLLGMDTEEVQNDLSRILEELKGAMSLMEKKELLLSQISIIRRDKAILSEKIVKARKRVSALKESEIEQDSHWKAFLERYRLDRETSHQDISLIARKILRLQELINDIEAIVKELDAKKREQKELFSSFLDKGFMEEYGDGPDEINIDLIEKIIIRLHDLAGLIEENQRLTKQQDQKDAELRGLEGEIKDIKDKLKDLVKRRQAVLAEWEEWLREKGFQDGLGPSDVVEQIQLLDKAKGMFSKREARQADLAELLKEMSAITERVSLLFSDLGPDGADSMDVVFMMDFLSQRLTQELEKDREYRFLSHNEGQLFKEEAKLRGEIRRLDEKIENILKDAGCTSKKELWSLLETFKEREHVLAEKTELEARLKAVSMAKDLQGIASFFGKKSQQELEREVERYKASLRDLDEQIQALVEQQAEMNLSLEKLISSDEHMELIAKRSCLVQEVKDLARRWSVLSMALHILEQARQRFEKENQPKVIREASRFFSTITSGRYANIAVGAGTDDIWAVTRQGERLEPKMLSTGTAEQLYLCLRFGLISACATGSEDIPVLMDDILVNFDPDRTRQAARAIGQLSRGRQVLFFTCHPHVTHILTEEIPEAELIEMEDAIQASHLL